MKTLLAFAFALPLLACGSTVETSAEGSGSASGSGGAPATTSTVSGTVSSTTGGVGGSIGTTGGVGGSIGTTGGVGGSIDTSSTSTGSTVCATNADCGDGFECGFADADGCAAVGQCFPFGPMCGVFLPGCSCTATTINIACTGLPEGYETAPLAHSGMCEFPTPADEFPCGKAFCKTGVEYCAGNLQVPDPVCVPLPPSCMPPNAAADCTCLSNVGCFDCAGLPGELSATCGEG